MGPEHFQPDLKRKLSALKHLFYIETARLKTAVRALFQFNTHGEQFSKSLACIPETAASPVVVPQTARGAAALQTNAIGHIQVICFMHSSDSENG